MLVFHTNSTEELTLDYNDLTGRIPSEVGRLSVLSKYRRSHYTDRNELSLTLLFHAAHRNNDAV